MRRHALTVLLVLLLAAPASAGHRTIGSNLKSSANRTESTPVDAVYWNTQLASGAQTVVPVTGEVAVVRLKGRVRRRGGDRPTVSLFFQTLRPMSGGRLQVISTTAPQKVPIGGRRNRVTTYRLARADANLCVRKGDYVGLATSGGFTPTAYPDGSPLQLFGGVSGSAFAMFTGAGGDMNGSVFTGRRRTNRELLMRTRIGTGRDASPFCR